MKESHGCASEAGILAGDRITHWGGHPVWTFGDLQYRFDKLPRDATFVDVTVTREGTPLHLQIDLSRDWWRTDLEYRYWSVDPSVLFEARPLTPAEKRDKNLNPGGFSSEVTDVDLTAQLMGHHTLEIGDIIVDVDGVQRDGIADSADLFIKLNKVAGESVTLGVLRGDQRLSVELKTQRPRFRK